MLGDIEKIKKNLKSWDSKGYVAEKLSKTNGGLGMWMILYLGPAVYRFGGKVYLVFGGFFYVLWGNLPLIPPLTRA